MLMPLPRQRGWSIPGIPQAAGRAGGGDPWRLVFVSPEADPSAGEYGLLDPGLVEETELPRDGLLSPVGSDVHLALESTDLPIPGQKPLVPGGVDPAALPIPARKPSPPPLPTASVPFGMRSHTLEMPPFISPAREDEWRAFHHELRRTGMKTETEIDAARTIFGLEGGMAFDPGGPSVAGLEDRTLRDVNNRRGAGLPEDSQRLTLANAAKGYRVVLDDVLNNVEGAQALGRVRDHRAALQMADMLFHFHHDGAGAIQQGINGFIDKLPEDVRNMLGLGKVTVDGDIGPQTLEVFNQVIDAGFAPQLRNAIADEQLSYLRRRWKTEAAGKAAGVSFEDWAGGQIERANYFR